jgi:hypothetical protein
MSKATIHQARESQLEMENVQVNVQMNVETNAHDEEAMAGTERNEPHSLMKPNLNRKWLEPLQGPPP